MYEEAFARKDAPRVRGYFVARENIPGKLSFNVADAFNSASWDSFHWNPFKKRLSVSAEFSRCNSRGSVVSDFFRQSFGRLKGKLRLLFAVGCRKTISSTVPSFRERVVSCSGGGGGDAERRCSKSFAREEEEENGGPRDICKNRTTRNAAYGKPWGHSTAATQEIHGIYVPRDSYLIAEVGRRISL